MNEEWRPVVGYEGLYEVSNTLKVRSVSRAMRVRRKGRYGNNQDYMCHRSYKFLKPYYISKAGRIKFHLHKRIKHGMGSGAQNDAYLYVDDIMKEAFSDS